MDPNECLVIINGEKPFRDQKFPLEEHPNYHELADYDPGNTLEYRRMFLVPDCEKEATQKRNFQRKAHANGNQATYPTNEDRKKLEEQRQKEAAALAAKEAEESRKLAEEGDSLNNTVGDALDEKGLHDEAQKARDGEQIIIEAALSVFEKDTADNIKSQIESGGIIDLTGDSQLASILSGDFS